MTAPLRLGRGEVHSWCVPLDVAPAAIDGFYATLSEDERARGARFHFERDRRRFVVARGALRNLLGCFLETDPGQIRFVYNASGKPALSPTFRSPLKFNLSHSGEQALIAVAAAADVGVDLEQVRPLPDRAEIARCFFSAAEIDALSWLPTHLQDQGFFKLWTEREAYVKARGDGLGSAQLAPDGTWSRYLLEPAPGYVGALVVEGSGWHFRSPHRVPLPSPSSRPLCHGRPSSSPASPS